MLEQLLSNMKDENGLNINCGEAFILSDKEGFLDKFEGISINCGTLFASSKAYAKLMAKNASINSGSSTIREISGEIIQLEAGATITEDMDFTDKFIISTGNAIVKNNGGKALAKAEGAHFNGKLFYPEELGSAFLANITGGKKPYPQDAHLVLGNKKIDELLFSIPVDKTHIWVHGEITALDEAPLIKAREKGLRYACGSLFTTESFDEKYGNLFTAEKRTLVPDGFDVAPDLSLTAGEVALYGPRIYVRGDLTLEKKNEDCLGSVESIIVKGKATIPASSAKAFRAVGKADEYELVEDNVGEHIKVNGFQTIGHDHLQAVIAKGETIRVKVNGVLLFDEGVTADDMDAISLLKVNGALILPDAAQGALTPKIEKVNGMINSIESITKLTGMTLPEILAKFAGTANTGGTNINTGIYILV